VVIRRPQCRPLKSTGQLGRESRDCTIVVVSSNHDSGARKGASSLENVPVPASSPGEVPLDAKEPAVSQGVKAVMLRDDVPNNEPDGCCPGAAFAFPVIPPASNWFPVGKKPSRARFPLEGGADLPPLANRRGVAPKHRAGPRVGARGGRPARSLRRGPYGLSLFPLAHHARRTENREPQRRVFDKSRSTLLNRSTRQHQDSHRG